MQKINTRIMLKHDSLTNWNESSLILKPGEVGVAYVDVATKDAKGNIIHVPTALLKVGENVENSTKKFSDLPFVSAIAADVYGWAKKEGIEITTIGEGECIANVEWKDDKLVLTRTDVVTPTELTTALASYYTKAEVDAITGDLSALNTTVKSSLVAAINEALQAVEVGGTGSVVTVTKEATPSTGSQATYVVKQGGKAVGDKIEIPVGYDETALAQRVTDAETAISTTIPAEIKKVDDKFADYTKTADLPTDLGDFTNNAGYAKTADVNKTLEDYAKSADLPTKVSDLENDVPYLVAADIAGKADSTKVAEDIAAAIAPLATTAALDEYKEAHKDDYTNKQIDDAIAAVSGDLANYYTKEEADAEFATPTEVIDAVNEALAKVSDADSITNITTLVEYVNENAGDLSALITEVYGAAEMTGDSRIDTAVADAAQAKADAAAAVGIANGAAATAGEAKTAAEGAVTTANEAKTAATEAQNSAAASATAAAGSAAEALASQNAAAGSAADADAAKQAAVAAQDAAEAAKGAAEAAQTAAESAEAAAAEYANNADDSAQEAITNNTQAQEAKGEAQAAKAAAEAAQAKAETAQAKAEAAQAAAEASNTSATAIANEAKGLAEDAVETANAAKETADGAAEAVAGLHAIATSGSIYDVKEGANTSTGTDGVLYLLFDCGTSTTVI